MTTPDMTVKYMFGCRVMSTWEPGATVDWIGTHEGREVTYVTGKCVTYRPNEELVYTVIDPAAAYPLTPENHLVVTVKMTETGNKTHVQVTQGDYTTVADGEKRYGHGNGWEGVLTAIKELVEVG